jgi:hypothetical protein
MLSFSVYGYRRMCLAASVALVALASAQVAQAETKLRWKFTKGQKTSYEISMDMTQDIKGGDLPLSMKIKQMMNMTWDVKDVADNGTATLNQTIDRVRIELSMSGANQEPIKYDSDAKDKPAGTEMMSRMYDAMIGKPFVLKMTPLGKVVDFKAPETVLAAFKNSPMPGGGNMFSEDGLKQMISQTLPPLPEEAVSEGTTWKQSSEMQAPPFGKQIMKTQYTYAGPAEIDGKKVDKIDVSMDLKIEPAGESQTKIRLKDAEAGGEILWDNSAGRPVESQITSSITVVIELNGMSAEQGVTTKMNMKQVAASNAREL